MVALLTAVSSLLALMLCDANIQYKDNLNSWFNVQSFELTPNEDSQSYKGILTTDNNELGTIQMILTLLKTYTSYNSHNIVPKSNGNCLYEGHVIHIINGIEEADLDSPVRLRYCNNELQGFAEINGKAYNLDYDRNQQASFLYTRESLKDDHDLHKRNCGVSDVPSLRNFEKSQKRLDGMALERIGQGSKRLSKRQSDRKPELYLEVQVTANHEFGHYEGIDRSRTNDEIEERVVRIMDLVNLIFSTLKRVSFNVVVFDVLVFTKETDPFKHKINLDDFDVWRREHWDTKPRSDVDLNLVPPPRDGGPYAGGGKFNSVCKDYATSWARDNWKEPDVSTASLIVHELMHVLGFGHINRDPENPCDCHHEACVMRGSVTPFADYNLFTPCQEDQLISYATDENYNCLWKKPDVPIYEPYCGDGAINQDWEECDCHGDCEYKCCTDECKFMQEGDVCFENSTIKSICADNICRATCNKGDICCDEFGLAKVEGSLCDPDGIEDDECQRRCDGITTGSCPIQSKNGHGCNRFGFNGRCYKENCLSFEIQCASIFGKEVVSKNMPDKCFKKNIDGTEYGNCGVKDDSNFDGCSSKKKMYRCGKLFCSLTDPDPASLIKIPGAEEVTVYPFDIDSQKCYSVSPIITSDGVDISYTKNGTWCNPGVSDRYCMGGKCLYKDLLEEFD